MFDKEISRRDFTKMVGGAAALGAVAYTLPNLDGIMSKEQFATAMNDANVIWVQASGCSGCSVSTLNYYNQAEKTDIGSVVLGDAPELKDNFVNFRFQPTLMAGQGYVAMESMNEAAKKPFILVVEGGIATKDNGFYAEVGVDESEHGLTIVHHMKELAPKATAIIALGSCATWGGIPAAKPNPTDIMSVMDWTKQENIDTPVVNIPGCPTHPDWLLLSVATILTGGLEALELDKLLRPKMFFSQTCHDQCPRRGQFEGAKFSTTLSDADGCLYLLGCRAPEAHGDCPHRRWNLGRWCVDSNAPCVACTEPSFPDNGPLFLKMSMWNPLNTVALGFFGVAAVGVGAGFVATMNKKKKNKNAQKGHE